MFSRPLRSGVIYAVVRNGGCWSRVLAETHHQCETSRVGHVFDMLMFPYHTRCQRMGNEETNVVVLDAPVSPLRAPASRFARCMLGLREYVSTRLPVRPFARCMLGLRDYVSTRLPVRPFARSHVCPFARSCVCPFPVPTFARSSCHVPHSPFARSCVCPFPVRPFPVRPFPRLPVRPFLRLPVPCSPVPRSPVPRSPVPTFARSHVCPFARSCVSPFARSPFHVPRSSPAGSGPVATGRDGSRDQSLQEPS